MPTREAELFLTRLYQDKASVEAVIYALEKSIADKSIAEEHTKHIRRMIIEGKSALDEIKTLIKWVTNSEPPIERLKRVFEEKYGEELREEAQ